MLYVHKKSRMPIDPLSAVRHGGPNHLQGVRAKFLVLFNVDILQRDGYWHYVFEFDTRDSLELSEIAKHMGKKPYPNDMDWKKWLGAGAAVITPAERWEIINAPSKKPNTGAVITDMREVASSRPVPGREPGDWNQVEEPPTDFVLSFSE